MRAIQRWQWNCIIIYKVAVTFDLQNFTLMSKCSLCKIWQQSHNAFLRYFAHKISSHFDLDLWPPKANEISHSQGCLQFRARYIMTELDHWAVTPVRLRSAHIPVRVSLNIKFKDFRGPIPSNSRGTVQGWIQGPTSASSEQLWEFFILRTSGQTLKKWKGTKSSA